MVVIGQRRVIRNQAAGGSSVTTGMDIRGFRDSDLRKDPLTPPCFASSLWVCLPRPLQKWPVSGPGSPQDRR
jgi:hypothetical protein